MEYSIVCPNDNTSITQNNYIIATKRLDALQKVLGNILWYAHKHPICGHARANAQIRKVPKENDNEETKMGRA